MRPPPTGHPRLPGICYPPCCPTKSGRHLVTLSPCHLITSLGVLVRRPARSCAVLRLDAGRHLVTLSLDHLHAPTLEVKRPGDRVPGHWPWPSRWHEATAEVPDSSPPVNAAAPLEGRIPTPQARRRGRTLGRLRVQRRPASKGPGGAGDPSTPLNGTRAACVMRRGTLRKMSDLVENAC